MTRGEDEMSKLWLSTCTEDDEELKKSQLKYTQKSHVLGNCQDNSQLTKPYFPNSVILTCHFILTICTPYSPTMHVQRDEKNY